MNQNGMQGAAGVPQQMGQQAQQQQPQMPGDQPDNPQIMNFLNEANENNWKEESYRNRVGCLGPYIPCSLRESSKIWDCLIIDIFSAIFLLRFYSNKSVKAFKSKNRYKIYLDAPNPNLKKGCDKYFGATAFR